MRPRRASRGAAFARGEEFEQENDEPANEEQPSEQEEELLPGRRAGRRPGKAPVEDDDDSGRRPETDADEEEQQPLGRGTFAGSRRGHAGDDEAGPSAKRGRRSTQQQQQQPLVKPEPAGGQPGPSRRLTAAAAARAARATPAELRAGDELRAEYRRARDHAAERAEGKAQRLAMEQASRAVVRHMLCSNSEKPGVPVKRTEVAALVSARFPTTKSKAVVTAFVLAHAAHYLVESMGLEMHSISKLNIRGREAAAGGEEGSQQYVLRSTVPPGLRTAFVLDRSQDAQRGLLMVVLALIHLANGKLQEDELFTQLEEVGIIREEPHPVFGHAATLLKLFCTRRYIQQDKQQGADGEIIIYRFAEQAVGPDAEIGEAAVKKFIEDEFAAGGGGGGGGGEEQQTAAGVAA